MIDFKDFVPKATGPAGLLSPAPHQNLVETLNEANQWIAANVVAVINVETVMVPNLRQSTSAAIYGTSGELRSLWYQIIRVWYDVK